MPPSTVCADCSSLSGADPAYCATALATYNAQPQVREPSRKDKVAFVSSVIERQIEERERRMDRIFSLVGIVYQVERGSRVSSRGANSGPVVAISGHQVRGDHRGGCAGSTSGGSSGAEGQGLGGVAGAGGGTGASITGDQNVSVVIGDNNQSGAGAGT